MGAIFYQVRFGCLPRFFDRGRYGFLQMEFRVRPRLTRSKISQNSGWPWASIIRGYQFRRGTSRWNPTGPMYSYMHIFSFEEGHETERLLASPIYSHSDLVHVWRRRSPLRNQKQHRFCESFRSKSVAPNAAAKRCVRPSVNESCIKGLSTALLCFMCGASGGFWWIWVAQCALFQPFNSSDKSLCVAEWHGGAIFWEEAADNNARHSAHLWSLALCAASALNPILARAFQTCREMEKELLKQRKWKQRKGKRGRDERGDWRWFMNMTCQAQAARQEIMACRVMFAFSDGLLSFHQCFCSIVYVWGRPALSTSWVRYYWPFVLMSYYKYFIDLHCFLWSYRHICHWSVPLWVGINELQHIEVSNMSKYSMCCCRSARGFGEAVGRREHGLQSHWHRSLSCRRGCQRAKWFTTNTYWTSLATDSHRMSQIVNHWGGYMFDDFGYCHALSRCCTLLNHTWEALGRSGSLSDRVELWWKLQWPYWHWDILLPTERPVPNLQPFLGFLMGVFGACLETQRGAFLEKQCGKLCVLEPTSTTNHHIILHECIYVNLHRTRSCTVMHEPWLTVRNEEGPLFTK